MADWGHVKCGRLGDSRVRGPGEVPVYRHGPFFFRQVQNKCGSKVRRSSKAITSRPFWYFGADTGWQDPHFPRFLRFSEGFPPRIFSVPETSPRELSAFSRTAEHGGFRGPCFGEMRRSGDWGIRQRTERRKITDEKGRRCHKKEEWKKMTDGGKKKIAGGENRYIWQMLGPLAGGSPGGREMGRLGTCEVREIGRLEGPGPGRSSGFPPRTLFFSAKSTKNGVRKCSGPQKLLCSDPFGTLGPKLGRRTRIFRGF